MYSFETYSPLRRARLLAILAVGAAALMAPDRAQAQDPDLPLPAQAVVADTVGAVLDSIVVVGNRYLEPPVIIGSFRVPLGERITYRDIREGQRRLWETGLFSDLEVLVRGGVEGLPVILTLRVEERPRVRELRVEGLTRIPERTVRDSLAIRSGEPYSPDRAARVSRFVRDELASRGVPFARVEFREDMVDEEEGLIDLVFSVEEGARVAIQQVRFLGNEAFSDSDLERVLGTRSEGFLWFRTGQFEEATLEEDLAVRLPEFYASSGFLDFAMVRDTLYVDPATGKGILELTVSEGPQYRVGSFSVEGNRRFPTSQLEALYRAEEGGLLRTLGITGRSRNADAFDQPGFLEATARVGELYANQGYIFAQVDPIINRRPAEEPGGQPTVDLVWSVEEGTPAYIRRIHITGNTFTYDRVIREQINLLPGQLYSQQDIIASYQRISGMGFFETPLPNPDVVPDPETGDVDITFEVVERQTGSINFGASMGGVSGVAGFLGYEQPNLFGQAKSGSLRWDFGRFQNNFVLSYTDPALRESRVSGTISLFDSRDRLFSFSSGERKRRGFLTRFGVPIPGALNTRVFTGYSLSRTEYRLAGGVDDTSLFGRPPGTQSQLSVSVRRFTMNSPLFPTQGSEQSWTTEFNGGLLGGDGDFTRHMAEGTWWMPVGQLGGGNGGRPIVFALGLSTRMGAVVGNADDFPFDRFWLGGVQFGQQLRGYEETTITPLGYFDRGSRGISDIQRLGDAYMVLGLEYAVRLNDNISVSSFFEAGNTWRNVREVDPTRMFRGGGLGLQLVTPFGPIGIDYAYGFDKPVPGWQLHFRMGGVGGG
ncbi:MAG: outer membrane protein assembly factor BamA [Gemmatimonadales bacterium]|nr:MAG: outer membrane protein assembly factor BamA [Gemmatimonadales bacterium]